MNNWCIVADSRHTRHTQQSGRGGRMARCRLDTTSVYTASPCDVHEAAQSMYIQGPPYSIHSPMFRGPRSSRPLPPTRIHCVRPTGSVYSTGLTSLAGDVFLAHRHNCIRVHWSTVSGRYKVDKLIGAGNYGSCWLVYDSEASDEPRGKCSPRHGAGRDHCPSPPSQPSTHTHTHTRASHLDVV